MIQTQFETKIQVLKTNNPKEHFASILSDYLSSHGIVHLSSCVDTPQQNRIVERKIGILSSQLDLLCSQLMSLNSSGEKLALWLPILSIGCPLVFEISKHLLKLSLSHTSILKLCLTLP